MDKAGLVVVLMIQLNRNPIRIYEKSNSGKYTSTMCLTIIQDNGRRLAIVNLGD
jgi:hypothetical protein